MLTKLCAKCGRLMPIGAALCDACKARQNDNGRQYDRRVRDKRSAAFYHSSQWQKVRDMALRRDGYQCQRCKARGIVCPAEEVHHIKALRVDWSRRLDLRNLVCLCHRCHMEVEKGAPGEWKKV
nr:MAG TPA: HNH endonuclease [Caudoviricetes sp.]